MPRFAVQQRVWYMNNGVPSQTTITATYDFGPMVVYGTEDYNGMYNMGVQEHDLFDSREALVAEYEIRSNNLFV